MFSNSPMFSRPNHTFQIGDPQKLPLWRNRRRSQNSPILARPKKGSLWNFSLPQHRRTARLYTFVLAILFSIVIFATASQVIFLLRADEQTLVSMLDMRLQRWLGLNRVYGYYDGVRSIVPSLDIMSAGYSNETALA